MLENRDWVKSVINMRDDDSIIIPLYVQIYGNKYSLLKLDDIKKRFAPSAFKIGYGTADAWFMKNSFPVNRINDFDLIDTFNEYDEKNERNIRYTVFESGDVDVIEGDPLTEEIHMYFDLLFNNVKDRVDAYFKALIESESIPVHPKEEPKKERDGLREYTGELSEYHSSWNPKFVSEEKVEDPLEELRKEIADYSQDDEDSPFEEDPEEIDEEEASEVTFEFEDDSDDDTETISGLIVETDRTGTEIRKATSVEFISQGETNDDYLAESVEFGNGQVDIFGHEIDDEDYSTDFDVF